MSKGFRQEHVISERKNMNMIWLVVYLPLWKIWKSVGMMTFPTEWKVIKFMFQTNQIIYRQKNARSQECFQSLSLTVLWFPNPSGCHPQIRGATTNASGTGPWWTQTINSIPVAMPKKKRFPDMSNTSGASYKFEERVLDWVDDISWSFAPNAAASGPRRIGRKCRPGMEPTYFPHPNIQIKGLMGS